MELLNSLTDRIQIFGDLFGLGLAPRCSGGPSRPGAGVSPPFFVRAFWAHVPPASGSNGQSLSPRFSCHLAPQRCGGHGRGRRTRCGRRWTWTPPWQGVGLRTRRQDRPLGRGEDPATRTFFSFEGTRGLIWSGWLDPARGLGHAGSNAPHPPPPPGNGGEADPWPRRPRRAQSASRSRTSSRPSVRTETVGERGVRDGGGRHPPECRPPEVRGALGDHRNQPPQHLDTLLDFCWQVPLFCKVILLSCLWPRVCQLKTQKRRIMNDFPTADDPINGSLERNDREARFPSHCEALAPKLAAHCGPP